MPNAMIDRLNAALEGRYTIEGELGEGGMATVYLARDLKHNRHVALKVLKPELAAVVGAERFLTEIETTANLQHPHILPLFDSGEADGFLFYVMPYIEGETLKDRIDREKQLPVDEAVGIAIAVANALQTAHDAGVIHRDIKPGNILLSRGEPLVADFGIALAVGAAGGNRLTETGLSVGTPFYMSPEQATGDQLIGPASDTYALACVLHEMLTGDPPYQGSTAQAVLGKIIQGAPPSTTQARPSVPPNVDGAILKALEKLPADRFTSAKDFAAALANPAFRYGEAAAAAGAQAGGWTRMTSVFAAASVVLAALAIWALARAPDPAPVNRFVLDIEEAVPNERVLGSRGRLALTPDGRRLVFVGPGPDLGTQLWLRELDQLDARPIPGTEGGHNPAISPDGLHVAYTTESGSQRELRRVPLDGGPSLLVADSLIDGGGVSWGWDGYIYTDARLEGDGFARVPENGGRPEIVTTPSQGESWHASPSALPNGRGVLFHIAGPGKVGVVDTETGEYQTLVDGLWGGYAASGHLIWVTRGGMLMAQPFDPDSFELSGRPVPLAENLLTPTTIGGANVAISGTGELAYITGSAVVDDAQMVWVDRAGQTAEFDADWTRPFGFIALSPDGEQMAAAISEGEVEQIWVRSTDGGPARKLTFEGSNREPSWLPGSESVGYVSRRDDIDGVGIYTRRADGTGGEVLVAMTDDARHPRWTPDRRWLTYHQNAGVVAQRLGDDGLPEGEPAVVVDDTDNFEGRATVSPDGRWIAYVSFRGGQPRMHVRPFPETDGGVWLISENPAVAAEWSADGSELLFIDVNSMTMSRVPVVPGTTFGHGSPESLFDMSPFRINSNYTGSGSYAVMPGGDRFLMLRELQTDRVEELVFVQNFFRVLNEQAPR